MKLEPFAFKTRPSTSLAALRLHPLPTLFGVFVLVASAIGAQPVDRSRGRDPRVDYPSLKRFGPWDDRNYQLTADDLAILAPNEEEQTDPIPAFFRIELRRAQPDLRRSGRAQYPRSALQIFRRLHTGYQINGRYYRRLTRQNSRFEVLTSADSEVASPLARFLSGEVRITSPEGAAESAIKIDPTNSNRVIAGTNGPGSGQKMFYSTNGGASWNAAAALPLGSTCCDPTVDWKSDGSLAHTATLGNCVAAGCAIWYYRSSDGGQTWNDLSNVNGDPRRELTTSGSDKEYLHVDQHSGSPYKDNVYLTWHDNNVLQFARSTDDGHTWTKTSFSSDPLGIGSDITTDKNGVIYYFWPAFDSSQIVMKKSTNGGASFAAGVTVVAATEASYAFPVPSMDTREAFVYTSADADLSNGTYGGSVYAAWTDSSASTGSNASNNHARIRVAYSRNGGASWTVTTPHETADINQVDRYHPWVAVGPDGKVHVAFYDTRRSAARTSVDLFYSASVDGGQSFSAPVRLTAAQSPKINDSFEFGDYNGLDAVMNDVIAIFTDNRNEGGGGGDSVDVYAAGKSDGDRPQVTITAPANGTTVNVGTPINFAGTATDVQDGNLTANLEWTSSLVGTIGNGGSFSTSLSAGTHTVTASVSDSTSLTGSDSISITVQDPGGNQPPQVTIVAPTDGSSFPSGSPIAFSASATDTEDGTLTASLAWTSSLDGALGTGGSLQRALSDGTHKITASVTDSGGLAGSASRTVTVGCGSFVEDFEGNTSGWQMTGFWHLTSGTSCASPGYSSATHATYFGQEGSCDYETGARQSGTMTSPAIPNVSSGSVLRFDYFRSVEETVNIEAERTQVQVSVDGSGSWQTVWSKNSFDASENAWTASGDLSLAAFADSTIRVRFVFDTLDEIENGFVGWLVDDLEVTATCNASSLGNIFKNGFESGNTQAWSSSTP